MTFDEFMIKVDRNLQRMVGETSYGLPDWDWWQAWSNGECPHATVCEMLAEQGYAI